MAKGSAYAPPPVDPPAPGRNFPGFDLAQNAVMAWMRMISAQGAIANNAWGEMKAGVYGFESAMKAAANFWELSYQVVEDAVKGPLRVEAPAWEYFYYDLANKNAVYREVRRPDTEAAWDVSVSRSQDPQADFEVTALHALGSKDTYDGVTVSRVPGRRDAVSIAFTGLAKEVKEPGEYIGFVYKRGASSEPPLFVILLVVKDGTLDSDE